MSLHPDKIVSLSLLANGASPTEREPLPSATVEQRAIDAAKTRQSKVLPDKPGAINELAYEMRGLHWANHLKRLKAQSVNGKPAKPAPQPSLVLHLPGQVTNNG